MPRYLRDRQAPRSKLQALAIALVAMMLSPLWVPVLVVVVLFIAVYLIVAWCLSRIFPDL